MLSDEEQTHEISGPRGAATAVGPRVRVQLLRCRRWRNRSDRPCPRFTGDGDLLALGVHEGVAILSPRQPIERLSSPRYNPTALPR
jgi:hypothetical protein